MPKECNAKEGGKNGMDGRLPPFWIPLLILLLILILILLLLLISPNKENPNNAPFARRLCKGIAAQLRLIC
jgi:hypothetical protein